MSKRQSAATASLRRLAARFIGTSTETRPGESLTNQLMPDGATTWVARTVRAQAAVWSQPGKTFAIGLGLRTRHAHRLVLRRTRLVG